MFSRLKRTYNHCLPSIQTLKSKHLKTTLVVLLTGLSQYLLVELIDFLFYKLSVPLHSVSFNFNKIRS